MTPRNPLDGKLIIDREAAERILKHLEMHSCSNVTAFRHAFIRPLEQALAQDNTGWAAVPVEETRQMMDAARLYKNLLTPWGRAYRAMLNASPALFETREKENEQA